MPSIKKTEAFKSAALNAARYQKNDIQQRVRQGLFQKNNQTPDSQDDIDSPSESRHRARLALMKAASIKEADKQVGAIAGEWAGGTVGSAVPVVGTAIGVFLGRLIGKKLGITGIIISIVLSCSLYVLFMIITIKGVCDHFGNYAQWIPNLAPVCKALKF